MNNIDFSGLYINAFVFGMAFAVLYDVMWTFRVSFFGKRFVWLTDFLATASAGIFISVLQYNFSSGKFRVLPFVIFPLGVFLVRMTFSRILRMIINKIIYNINSLLFALKIKLLSSFRLRTILRSARMGFGLSIK
jgi:hypothetical protein